MRNHTGTLRGEKHIMFNAMQCNGWQMTRERERDEGSESVVEEIYGHSNRAGS